MIAGKYNLLVTSAGRRVGLIECFRKAAADLGIEIVVHACDLQPEISPACQLADHWFAVPRGDSPEYTAQLLEYCRTHQITALVPTIDPELLPLAIARDQFAAIGTFVHVSSPETIEIVRDKRKTMEELAKAGVPVPQSAKVEEIRDTLAQWDWPAFIKPISGSASRGIAIVEGPDQIAESYPEPMLLQQYLQGPEYTINGYIDAKGELLCAIPHLRISIRAGEVEKGRTVKNPEFTRIAQDVAAAMPGARGAFCFQLIDDPKYGPKIFEINARFGGGYPLADHAGGRFAESVILESLGRPACATDQWRDGAMMLRYDAAVFQ